MWSSTPSPCPRLLFDARARDSSAVAPHLRPCPLPQPASGYTVPPPPPHDRHSWDAAPPSSPSSSPFNSHAALPSMWCIAAVHSYRAILAPHVAPAILACRRRRPKYASSFRPDLLPSVSLITQLASCLVKAVSVLLSAFPTRVTRSLLRVPPSTIDTMLPPVRIPSTICLPVLGL